MKKFIEKYYSLLIFFCLILVTKKAYLNSVEAERNEFLAKQDQEAIEFKNAIVNRMFIHETILKGGKALFKASEKVTRDEWKSFIESHKLEKYWPGIQGVGFSVPIKKNEKQQHIASIRAQGFKNYNIKPLGKRDFYTSIIFLEPFNWRNQRAFGFDMWSNEIRREAMKRALETGESATSSVVTLVQETKENVQRGFLTYVPLYDKPDNQLLNINDRKKSFKGWVYSPYRVKDLIEGIKSISETNFSIELFDGTEENIDSLLISTLEDQKKDSLYKITYPILIHGRIWTFNYYTENKQAYLAKSPLIILLLGFLISTLIPLLLSAMTSAKDQAEKIASKKKSETQALLNVTGVGLWSYNHENRKLNWDESMFKLYDLNSNKFHISLDNWQELIHPDDQSTFEKYMKNIVREKKSKSIQFRTINPKTEKIRHIKSQTELIKNQRGDVEQIIGLNRDTTQEVEIKKELNKQQSLSLHQSKLAAIGELAAGVGHEINNPLAIITSYASSLNEKLSDDSFEPDQITKDLTKIQSAAERISHVVKGLRNFSRADNAKKVNFDVINTIESTVNLVKEIYHSEGINVNFVNYLHETYVYGNQGRLQQVFMNLISNAKDAVEKTQERNININTQLNEGFIVVSFEDSGVGISDEVRSRMFTPFFTTKDVNKGTGIGLSIAHNHVKELNGFINVLSEKDKGSTFKVSLPVADQPPPLSPTQSPAGKKLFNLKTIKGQILLAEDDQDLREILSNMLTEMDLDVLTARDGQEAFELFSERQESIELIISDMKMPVLDGPGFLKKINESKPINEELKFIFITGDVSTDFSSSQEKFGPLVKGHIFKPFNKQSIRKILSEIYKD